MGEKISENDYYADYPCPKCGSRIITHYGPGMEIDFCTNENCDYEFTYYTDILDFYDLE